MVFKRCIHMYDWLELVLSSFIHTLYALHMLAAAVAFRFTNAMAPILESEINAPDRALAPPVVLVHGIFGFGKGKMGGLPYFGGAEKMDNWVLVPDLGSLTSIHDRARELFYYLKGGRIDYGAEHSKAAGHSQFGKVYEHGNYPEWDYDHPVHFVGHSAGVQVIRVLQQMLADKAFNGYENTHENWVQSVTALSGAFNGTTRTYLDGMMPDEWRSMRPLCLLQLIRIGATIFEWLDISWMKSYYNFGFDHFEMSWRKVGFRGLVDGLMGNTGPFVSGDWILPDLTIQGSTLINSSVKTFPNTFYFSYATKGTRKAMGFAIPCFGMHPILIVRSWQMSHFQYPSEARPPYKGYRDQDWYDNDGALNTISTTHPRLPNEHPNHFVSHDKQCHPMQPGIWYYKILEADHIFFVLNRERAGVQFDLMYDAIFERCRKHMLRSSCEHKPL